MNSPKERQQALEQILAERVLVLDGAMGSMLHQRLTVDDFGGPEYENCCETVLRVRPEIILGIHRTYFDAGADMVETDSFGGHPITLADFHLQDRTHELNFLASKVARQAAEEFSKPGRPRFVGGSMGPTTKSITLSGNVTFRELTDGYYLQAKGLVQGGADVLLVETCNATSSIKAALIGIDRLRREIGRSIPTMVSGTIEPMGTMLAGQPADAFCASVAHADLLSIGLNCATGPEFMTDHLRTISEMCPVHVSCYPNAGLPNEDGKYLETPTSLAAQLERFIGNGWINIVGGCCGTTDAHIKAIAQMAEGKRPRPLRPPSHRAYYAGVELVEAEESVRPLIVGERTNVIGSRLFKNMVAEE